MFCPYVLKTYIKATIIDNDGNGNECGHIISEQYIHEDCKKEECGAWYKGKCRYNK